MTTRQYVDRVFVPDNLPENMACKTSLSMAMELINPCDLRDRLTTALLRRVSRSNDDSARPISGVLVPLHTFVGQPTFSIGADQ